jgi:Family of unknown function (DUF5670)
MSWLMIALTLVLWFLGVFFRVGGEAIDLLLVVPVGIVLFELLPIRNPVH